MAAIEIVDSELVEIILTHWIPPLITILVGGTFASLLIPRWQVHFNRSRIQEQRRVAICEEIMQIFPIYIINWERLISISRHEQTDGPLDDAELARKTRYIEERDSSREKLYALLNKSKIYFSHQTSARIEEFIEWDRSLSSKRVNELPASKEWNQHKDEISGLMIEDFYQTGLP